MTTALMRPIAGLYRCPRCAGSVFRDRLDGTPACVMCARRFYAPQPIVQDEAAWWASQRLRVSKRTVERYKQGGE